MAAHSGEGATLSKADYLKRYLSGNGDSKKSKEKRIKKKRVPHTGKGMKIVDDDVDWRQLVTNEEKENDEEDEAPVVADVIDERPEEVQQMETYRMSNKWKVMGEDSPSLGQTLEGGDAVSITSFDSTSSKQRGDRSVPHEYPDDSISKRIRHDSPDLSPRRPKRNDSPDTSPVRRTRHDSSDTSPVRRKRHDSSPEVSPLRNRKRHSPDVSPLRNRRHDSPDTSPPRRTRHDSPDLSPPRSNVPNRRHDSSSPSPLRRTSKASPSVGADRSHRSTHADNSTSSQAKKTKGSSKERPRGRTSDPDLSPPRRRGAETTTRALDSDQSPPRKRPQVGRGYDSDLSPPRKKRQDARGGGSDSDLSPPRRKPTASGGSDPDLSPPRRPSSSGPQGPRMLSGGAAGLVSVETLRKEQEDNRRREKHNKPLEEESRNAQTVFRDKSGRKRDLDAERQEQSRKAGEKAEKDEKYAKWGKGLAQGQMQQQNLEDAIRESQKPLARHADDEDLDRMLREQEREGDPMAALLRKKKAKENKLKGIKEKPRYNGPAPPPNRFNIMPGYRWDGVDRSNGFEAKRYARMADKKAVQEMAYKWSVEDM